MPAMKPEIFNYDMIRAILEGRKTVTRRLIKRSGHKVENLLTTERYRGYRYAFSAWDCMEQTKTGIFLAPRHRPGDIIYVRENYAVMSELPDICDTSGIVYMADFSPRELEDLKEKHFCWKPSIYMPRKYARLFLQVTNVWPEHVRDITEKQACLEGIDKYDIGSEGIAYGAGPNSHVFHETATDAFAELWNSTIMAPDYPLYGWLANPMVWVYEFKVVSREEVFDKRGDA